MLCLQSLSLVILPYMSHSVSQSAAMCQFSGAWAAEAAPAHAAPLSPSPQLLSALCDTLSWAYSRMCWNRLWYKWCCQGAGSWSLGNERRCVEAFDNQPHSDDHLPQAACDRGNITQTGPHDCRDHPAQNDRVSKQAPDGQPAHHADWQQHAVGGMGRKMIRRAKNGVDESDPHNADNESREVHHLPE